MKSFIVRMAAAAAFLMATTVGAWSDDWTDSDAVTMDDGTQLWFVEMSSPPTEDGGDLATIQQEQAAFRVNASQAGIRYTERHAFSKLWNGLSIAVHPQDVKKLDRVLGMTRYPVIQISLPPTENQNEPDLATALSMTGADVAQNELGLTGAGVKVGIIDTGLDYDHADLGGDGVTRANSSNFPTSRVVGGYDLVGDAFTSGAVPVPDAYPDDCNGHGTHVSGIVGANGAVKGVAPGVTFTIYRVFGCAGTTTADIMVDAMERALNDGVQVVNMSIGSARQWPQYPTAQASDRLVTKGVVVVASIGNDGTTGLYASGAPGVGKKVIGVASFENTFINQSAFSVSPDGHITGYNNASTGGLPPFPALPPSSGTFPMGRTGTTTSTADACAALPAGSLANKIALIRRGSCGFYNKCINAQNAGAIGVVIYNNVAGGIIPNISPVPVGAPPVTIPVVAITATEGALINGRIAAGPTSLTWGEVSSVSNPSGGLISGFSSYGPPADLSIKPDLGAPGGFIRSTYPLEQGGYANISGTSMSSPHVAGAVALLLQAHPSTAPNAVRDILQNSAEPHPRAGDMSQLDNVNRQGAGMLNIPDAVLATTRITPGKLSLGESELGPVTKTLQITNDSSSPVTYDLANLPAAGNGSNTFPPVTFNQFPASVSFSQNPVTVPANGSASVDVTIAPNASQPGRSLYGGYIEFSPQSDGQQYRVPYLGLAGDYQAGAVLTSGGNGFPWLAKQVGTSFVNQPAGASFTMIGIDVPNIVFHLDHQISQFLVEVFEPSTGKNWHRADFEKYLPRNAGATGAFVFSWDGTAQHGTHAVTVPNGQYVLKVTILKALGDAANPAHVETWTSPLVTLARPNITMAGLWLSENVVEAEEDVVVSAAVRHTGANPAPGVSVQFFDNEVLFHTEIVDLGSEETRVLEAPWHVDSSPSHHLRITAALLDDETDLTDNAVQIDITPGEIITGVGGPTPKVLALATPRPNPSSREVAFRFQLPQASPVALEVFDLSGRRVRTWRWANLPAGDHSVRWDGLSDSGSKTAAGAVMYRLSAMGQTLTQKAVRLP